ncbi:MAG: tRNA preQ1(34) S-adenosylmethionine ribosyltransferase-isomerase QueA [Candidatus Adiutrix sp.]|jgi:S-adenosylmethionine:tRNA ribosyltransferase-isomerase|nr:tRNA preQ1(34) S-adenosylmethionine ribosyltransferase-isomerase QueA [Candidatus Adiutrix sp.]
MNDLPELAPFSFELPPELVAQTPPKERGNSRLMLLNREGRGVGHHHFSELPELLPPGALLVFNQVRVSRARLLGRKADSGGRVEAFILQPPPQGSGAGDYDLWCLVHPGRRIKAGRDLIFSHPGTPERLSATALDFDPEGRRLLRFHFGDDPEAVLERLGHVPLPFYIKRPDESEDRDRYQTVYGRSPGAVAAPTAGLHFTREMLETLKARGFESTEVTLKVSAGTFAPLTRLNLESGRLHREHISVPEAAAAAVSRAKAEGRPVLAVGTTTVRSLEWAAEGGRLAPREGWGDLFIRPGWKFKVVDALLSNFHLPASSLLMLVSALAGRERVLEAYGEALKSAYRFYSYGDAMLIV